MIKFFKKIFAASLALLPAISFAANGGGLKGLFGIVKGILDQVVILLIGLAAVFFLFGILKYIARGDDEESQKKGRNIMIYGIIGLFVMVSFWGIVNILMNTFGFQGGEMNIEVPYFDGDVRTLNQ